VNVWRFIAQDTIEEHILGMADEKQQMVDDLVEGRDTGRTLGIEELRRLLAAPTVHVEASGAG
jgi:SNF2 family DNA or RNA helicase